MSLLENPPCWKIHLLEWSVEWRIFGISEWRMFGILQWRIFRLCDGGCLDFWNSAMEDFWNSAMEEWRIFGILEFCNGGLLDSAMEDLKEKDAWLGFGYPVLGCRGGWFCSATTRPGVLDEMWSE